MRKIKAEKKPSCAGKKTVVRNILLTVAAILFVLGTVAATLPVICGESAMETEEAERKGSREGVDVMGDEVDGDGDADADADADGDAYGDGDHDRDHDGEDEDDGNKYFLTIEDNIYDKVLRLHVLADSDSERDQSIKLKVRDGILGVTSELLEGCGSLGEALETVTAHEDVLIDAVERILTAEGAGYGAVMTVGLEMYPDRDYGGVIYPAGEYTSVRILLGSGEGRNWWCVLFPSLCLTPATPDGGGADSSNGNGNDADAPRSEENETEKDQKTEAESEKESEKGSEKGSETETGSATNDKNETSEEKSCAGETDAVEVGLSPTAYHIITGTQEKRPRLRFRFVELIREWLWR